STKGREGRFVTIFDMEEAQESGGRLSQTSWWQGWTRAWQNHHLFPEMFRDRFRAIGINIDRYLVRVPDWANKWFHRGGFNTNGGWWNWRWKEFFKFWDNPANWRGGRPPTPQEMEQLAKAFMETLRREAGIGDLPFVAPAAGN